MDTERVIPNVPYPSPTTFNLYTVIIHSTLRPENPRPWLFQQRCISRNSRVYAIYPILSYSFYPILSAAFTQKQR